MANDDDLFSIAGGNKAGSSSRMSSVGGAKGAAPPPAEPEEPPVPPHMVEAFCINLSRLSQGLRLYSRDNDLLRQMWDRLDETWKLVRDRSNAPVRLIVTPQSLVYFGKEVFKQEGRENMAVRLFRDGIRAITFDLQVGHDELASFLTIFDQGTERWQNEADCVDRLWLLNLEHIAYEAVDGFDSLVDQTRGEVVTQMAAGLSLLTGTSDAPKAMWGNARDTDVDLEEILELHEHVHRVMLPPPHEFWEFENTGAPPVFEQLHQLVRFVASVPQPVIGGQDLSALAARLFSEQLKMDGAGMFERLTGTLDAPAPIGPRMTQVWQKTVDPLLVATLLGQADPGSPRHAALSAILQQYLNISPDKLVLAVAESTSDEAAIPLVRLVHTLSPDPITLWLGIIDRISPAVVEEILWSLAVEQLTSPVAQQFLDYFWGHQDVALVEMAASATPLPVLPVFHDKLLAFLEHGDVERQRIASDNLRRLNDRTTGIFILNQVRKLRPGAPRPLVDAYLRALMALGGDRYVDFLVQALGPVATGEGGWFGKKAAMRAHTNPLGDEAVLLALARFGSERCWEVIRAVFSRAESDVKAIIVSLRNEWESKRPGDPDVVSPPPPKRLRPEAPLYVPPAEELKRGPQVGRPLQAGPSMEVEFGDEGSAGQPASEAGGQVSYKLGARRPDPGAAGGEGGPAQAGPPRRPSAASIAQRGKIVGAGSSSQMRARPAAGAPTAARPPQPPPQQPPPPRPQTGPPPVAPRPQPTPPPAAPRPQAGVVPPRPQAPVAAPQRPIAVSVEPPTTAGDEPSSEELRGIRPVRARRPVPGAAVERRALKVQPEQVDPSIARGRPGGAAAEPGPNEREAPPGRPARTEQTTRNLRMPAGMVSPPRPSTDGQRPDAVQPDRRNADTRKVRFTDGESERNDAEDLDDLLKGYLGPRKE